MRTISSASRRGPSPQSLWLQELSESNAKVEPQSQRRIGSGGHIAVLHDPVIVEAALMAE